MHAHKSLYVLIISSFLSFILLLNQGQFSQHGTHSQQHHRQSWGQLWPNKQIGNKRESSSGRTLLVIFPLRGLNCHYWVIFWGNSKHHCVRVCLRANIWSHGKTMLKWVALSTKTLISPLVLFISRLVCSSLSLWPLTFFDLLPREALNKVPPASHTCVHTYTLLH